MSLRYPLPYTFARTNRLLLEDDVRVTLVPVRANAG